MRANGANATVTYASDSNIDRFRAIARENLQTPHDFMLVNYERAALGQSKSGHISPLAAYDEQTDRLLILDVAAYKYPPVWVTTADLWNAMNTVDPASNRTRGFVVGPLSPTTETSRAIVGGGNADRGGGACVLREDPLAPWMARPERPGTARACPTQHTRTSAVDRSSLPPAANCPQNLNAL